MAAFARVERVFADFFVRRRPKQLKLAKTCRLRNLIDLIKTIRGLYSECAASISISSGRLLKWWSAAASRARLRNSI
jgi:hypothetical protein